MGSETAQRHLQVAGAGQVADYQDGTDLAILQANLGEGHGHQTDLPTKEPGTLWRDAVLAHTRTVPPDILASSNHLDELNKYLTQLRKSETGAANTPQGWPGRR